MMVFCAKTSLCLSGISSRDFLRALDRVYHQLFPVS